MTENSRKEKMEKKQKTKLKNTFLFHPYFFLLENGYKNSYSLQEFRSVQGGQGR